VRLFLLITCWSLLLLSCKEVTFREAQPTGISPLKEVPSSLQGIYQVYDRKEGGSSDTLIIESWGYRFKDNQDKDLLGRGVLSDSLVVKFYENYYFVNFRDGDQWVLRLIRQKSPGVYELMSIDIQDEARQKEMLNKLSGKFKIKEIKRDDSTYYQINPSSQQLIALIEEGYFTGVELRRMK